MRTRTHTHTHTPHTHTHTHTPHTHTHIITNSDGCGCGIKDLRQGDGSHPSLVIPTKQPGALPIPLQSLDDGVLQECGGVASLPGGDLVSSVLPQGYVTSTCHNRQPAAIRGELHLRHRSFLPEGGGGGGEAQFMTSPNTIDHSCPLSFHSPISPSLPSLPLLLPSLSLPLSLPLPLSLVLSPRLLPHSAPPPTSLYPSALPLSFFLTLFVSS